MTRSQPRESARNELVAANERELQAQLFDGEGEERIHFRRGKVS